MTQIHGHDAQTQTYLSALDTHTHGCCCRYADVMVHRVLAATLGITPLPPSMRDAAGLRAVVDNLNLRHRNAQMAGRASVELHTLIFFRDRTTLADARITKVKRIASLVCTIVGTSSCSDYEHAAGVHLGC